MIPQSFVNWNIAKINHKLLYIPVVRYTVPFKKNYLRDFVSSFGNIKASFIFRSFLTKFDRFAEINK